jgi:hypothetical protein
VRVCVRVWKIQIITNLYRSTTQLNSTQLNLLLIQKSTSFDAVAVPVLF